MSAKPRPTSAAWVPINDNRLFPDGSAWQLGDLGAPGSLSVLVLDMDARWQVSVSAGPDRSFPTDEQMDDVRVDFGLVAVEEWPPLDGVRMLVTLITDTSGASWLERWVDEHADEARRQLAEGYGEGWAGLSRDRQIDALAYRLGRLVTPPGMHERRERNTATIHAHLELVTP